MSIGTMIGTLVAAGGGFVAGAVVAMLLLSARHPSGEGPIRKGGVNKPPTGPAPPPPKPQARGAESRCPTCGQRVRVGGSGNTHYYIGVDAEALARLQRSIVMRRDHD